jgi:hypothetical protein
LHPVLSTAEKVVKGQEDCGGVVLSQNVESGFDWNGGLSVSSKLELQKLKSNIPGKLSSKDPEGSISGGISDVFSVENGVLATGELLTLTEAGFPRFRFEFAFGDSSCNVLLGGHLHF